MRNFLLLLACVAALAISPVHAQSNSAVGGAAPIWEVHLQLQKSFASPLGQKAMAMLESEKPEEYQKFLKFAEAIGLDPRTDIGEVVVFGDGFTENDATVIANLGQSTGNLEGWILAAPGYRSEDLDSNTLLHSMNVEEKDARAWFALPKHASGNFVLVGSLNQSRTVDLARQVLAGNPSPVPNPLSGNALMSFVVNDLSAVPMEIDEDDPGAAIVRIIDRLALNVASDADNLNVALDLTTSSAGKARQISQLLTGLKALVQLAPMDEPEARKVAQVLDTMVVTHTEGQLSVQASLSTSYRLLEELLGSM